MDPYIHHLRAEINQLRQAIYQRPVRVPGPTPSTAPEYLLAHIVGGNDIQPTGAEGISYEPDDITAIPNYDPALNPATIDGIGVAWVVFSRQYVLVANFHDTAFFKRDYFKGSPVLLGAPITLPTEDDPPVIKTLYRITAIG